MGTMVVILYGNLKSCILDEFMSLMPYTTPYFCR